MAALANIKPKTYMLHNNSPLPIVALFIVSGYDKGVEVLT